MAMLGGDMLESSPFDFGNGYDACESKYLDVLDKVVWYNNLGKYVLAWKDLSPSRSGYIFLNYWEYDYEPELASQLEIIGMIATILYGSYDKSVDRGGINQINSFHRFIDNVTKTYRNNQEETL